MNPDFEVITTYRCKHCGKTYVVGSGYNLGMRMEKHSWRHRADLMRLPPVGRAGRQEGMACRVFGEAAMTTMMQPVAWVDPLNGECEWDVSRCSDCGDITDWHQGPSERQQKDHQQYLQETAVRLGDAMGQHRMLTIELQGGDDEPSWSVWSSEDAGFGSTLLEALLNLNAVQS